MASSGFAVAHTIYGVLGLMTSLFLFASPRRTMWQIHTEHQVQDFNPYSYLAIWVNCAFWFIHSLPGFHPDVWMAIVSGVGIIVEIGYLVVFHYYDTNHNRRILIKICFSFQILAVAFIATFALLYHDSHERRSKLIGILACITGVIMYTVPGLTLYRAITTNDVNAMPLLPYLAGLANSLIWLLYAVTETKYDTFIVIGSAIGVLSSFVQVGVYVCCCYFQNENAPDNGGYVAANDGNGVPAAEV